MAIKPPIPESPYLPVGGINPDSNGLSLSPEQCVMAKNLRFDRKEISTRGGTRLLGSATTQIPGTDPALHFHTYKAPGSGEILFAFTKNRIYKYNGSVWAFAIPGELINSCDSLTGFTAPWTTSFVGNSVCVEGAASLNLNRKLVSPASYTFTSGDVFLDYTGTTYDLSDYNTISFWHKSLRTTSTEALNFKIQFYTNADWTGLIEEFTDTFPAVTGSDVFKEFRFDMNTALTWTSVKSWRIVANETKVFVGGYACFIDWVSAHSALSSDVTRWETTRFIDNTLGETVVAAGSSPSNLDDAESDQGSRVLYNYNPTTGLFEVLSLYEYTGISDEDTGVNGPAALGVVSSVSALAGTLVSGFQEVQKGTVTFYTLQTGTIGTCSMVLTSSDRYLLVPLDTTRIVSGANSYVLKNGSAWKIEFASGAYSGLDIYVEYNYKKTISYKPRFVQNFHNRLLIGNTYEGSTYYGWRLRWSEVGKIGEFTGLNYLDLIDSDVSSITAMEPLGYYMVIYKVNTILKGSYTGGTGIFSFVTVWKDGLQAGRTVKTWNGRHFLLGKDDVYMFDGNSLTSVTLDRSTGNYRVKNTIFEQQSLDSLNNCFAEINARFQEYWLWITKTGETYPSSVYVYNILLDIWYYFEFSPTSAMGFYHVPQGATIDALIGTIDDQNWNFNSTYMEGARDSILLALGSDSDIYVMDETIATDYGYTDALGVWTPGSAISQYLITRDFIFSGLPALDRTERVNFEAKGTSVQILSSEQYSKDSTAFRHPITLTLDNYYRERRYFPDLVCEHIRFYFIPTNYISIRWIQPYAIDTETADE